MAEHLTYGEAERPNYGRSLLATVIGAAIAALVMAIPSWLWADNVVDVPFSSIVGKSPQLDTTERGLLYGGNLVFVFVGFLVFTWATRWLYRRLNLSPPPFWEVFFFLIGSALLASIIGFFFPFLGLLIAVFLPAAAINSWAGYKGQGMVGNYGAVDKPLTSIRPPG
jgi:ABC-type multidrug transport system fused ATPase/permease subunit